MLVRFCQLRRKEVINLCDGCKLGYVGDLEVCLPEGTVKAIIVFGPCRFFGLFGRGEDTIYRGIAFRNSGMTSCSSISRFSGATAHSINENGASRKASAAWAKQQKK